MVRRGVSPSGSRRNSGKRFRRRAPTPSTRSTTSASTTRLSSAAAIHDGGWLPEGSDFVHRHLTDARRTTVLALQRRARRRVEQRVPPRGRRAVRALRREPEEIAALQQGDARARPRGVRGRHPTRRLAARRPHHLQGHARPLRRPPRLGRHRRVDRRDRHRSRAAARASAPAADRVASTTTPKGVQVSARG